MIPTQPTMRYGIASVFWTEARGFHVKILFDGYSRLVDVFTKHETELSAVCDLAVNFPYVELVNKPQLNYELDHIRNFGSRSGIDLEGVFLSEYIGSNTIPEQELEVPSDTSRLTDEEFSALMNDMLRQCDAVEKAISELEREYLDLLDKED